jgi:hypothetical protein
MIGGYVLINGVPYLVNDAPTAVTLTLNSSAGTLTGATLFWDPNIQDDGTGTIRSVHSNFISDTSILGPTVAAAATTTLPPWGAETYFISGTTAITTLSPVWTGRKVKLIFTNAAPGGLNTGGNIATTVQMLYNAMAECTYEGLSTKWYCMSGNGTQAYNAAGTQQLNGHVVFGTCVLGTSCAVTLAGSAAYTTSSSYYCAATDQTTAAAVKVVNT